VMCPKSLQQDPLGGRRERSGDYNVSGATARTDKGYVLWGGKEQRGELGKLLKRKKGGGVGGWELPHVKKQDKKAKGWEKGGETPDTAFRTRNTH